MVHSALDSLIDRWCLMSWVHLAFDSRDNKEVGGCLSILGASKFGLSGCNGATGRLGIHRAYSLDYLDAKGRWASAGATGGPIGQVGMPTLRVHPFDEFRR